MNFKKLLSLLLIFSMIFSFVACGDKDKDDDDNRSSKSSSLSDDDDDKDDDDKDDYDKDDDDKDDYDEDDKGDNDEDEDEDDDKKGKADKDDKDDDVLDGYNEVDLPSDYPDDIFPIYKGSRIWLALVDKSSDLEIFNISAVCKGDAEKISSFYKNIVMGGEDFEDYSMDKLNMFSGKYEGYEYAITCAPEDSNKDYTIYTLVLKKLPSIESLLKELNEGELPDNYPDNYFPIVEGAAISHASESESNGEVSYYLNLYTDKTFKEILTFYEETIGEITNKSKSSSTDDFELSGEAHGYYFSINGRNTERHGIYLVEYWINLDPISE
ncbi:MAG: hypothetical protein ACOYIF_02270 [Acetivibrionales bacterium]|jgi:hypothetical protein